MKKKNSVLTSESGQVLVTVFLMTVVLLLMVPAMVQWMQQESKSAVKNNKNTTAFNLAEAAVERGYWKVKSSTVTASLAFGGTALTGYNFDVTYTDVPGGTYRIQISTAGSQEIRIVGEGRDSTTQQTRALAAVYKNQAIFSPLLTNGNVTLSRGFVVFWGPIMSQGNVTFSDDDIGNLYFPQKYAAGVVVGTAKNPRDTNGLAPPNEDGNANPEWWSDYQYIPELPLLDFADLRSSASATGTLNVYGCSNSTPRGTWDGRYNHGGCSSSGNHNLHFGDSWDHPKSPQASSTNTYVWYWDGDVTLSGNGTANQTTDTGANGTGLRGSLIVRGNLTIDSPGQYFYTGPVPVNAWQQQIRTNITGLDTSASGEYPADLGYHNSNTTFKFGTDTFSVPTVGGGVYSTPGMRGFTYVGGNLTITNSMDFNGAVWVNGSVITNGTGLGTACGLFFDDTLQLPTLNVILIQQSWQETTPSTTPWH